MGEQSNGYLRMDEPIVLKSPNVDEKKVKKKGGGGRDIDAEKKGHEIIVKRSPQLVAV